MQIDKKKLACAMIDADLNTKQLAEKAGLSRVTVSYLKNGKSCSEETLKKIAKALKVEKCNLMKRRS